MAAEALWMTVVKRRPMRTPMIGFEKLVRAFMNAGLLLRSLTEPLILFMPNINTAKPSMMSPRK